MNSSPLRRRGSVAAFTLLELLVVISIIAILMGLLIPVISTIMDRARRADAKTTSQSIVTAVKAYYIDYGKYPPTDGANMPSTPDDVIVGDSAGTATTSNAGLFNVLRARVDANTNPDNQYNPRKVVYFEGRPSSNREAPRNGFADFPGSSGVIGALYDPWGSQYCVAIDANYDNYITKIPHTDFRSTAAPPPTGVAIFSLGKDGIVGSRDTNGAYQQGSKVSDDVISWQ
jgi:prepilin-type N-terminal cleavage/methylation domain-containing protein